MTFGQTLVGLALLGMSVGGASAKSYNLAEIPKSGDCSRIQLSMKLQGEMKFLRDGKMVPVALNAQADHVFPERVVAVGKAGGVEKVARLYEKARAAITVGRDQSERTLRADRSVVVAQRFKDQPVVYSLGGAFFRPELELTSSHFDTLALGGLLPGKEVAVGDTWKVAPGVVQALCHFEGLTEQDLVCKLDKVEGNLAIVSIQGTAQGIDLGSLVKVKVDGTYRFDLETSRLSLLEWKQKDERDQGPANPASTVEMVTIVQRAACDTPAQLSTEALEAIPEGEDVPPQLLQLDYSDAKGRFDLLYPRDWQIVSQTESHLVMRLVERGDFVAQVTITPWTPAPAGKHMSGEEFKEMMNRTPSWEPQTVLHSAEVPADKGTWIYRLSQSGKLDGLEVVQTFFLVAEDDGRQVVLAFTMTPKQAERLGTRDLSLAGSIDFPKKK